MIDTQLEGFAEIQVNSNDEFLIIRETLTRVGTLIGHQTLSQECFLFHKRGRYYIVHYKQLEALNGANVVPTPTEVLKASTTASMLVSWGLTRLLRVPTLTGPLEPVTLTVVQAKDAHRWNLVPLYSFYRKK